MADLWYKDAIVYSLDVRTFLDGNGDGVGDFRGATAALDYLAGLGVNCVWLLPFYPSPGLDNGYDVTDFYGVHPSLGDLGHVVEFMRGARARGIRVLIDLVVNHTSDQHPWFQAARSDPRSPYREYYHWSTEKPAGAEEGMVFPGVQQSTWTWDDAARAYYYHRFYRFEPDLNLGNPTVQDEIKRIMGFWLELGVSGFRLDAAPFLIEMRSESGWEQDYNYLEEFRRFLSWRRGDAIMLAEANVRPETIAKYFGRGDRMHLVFDFYANQHLFLALARGEAAPLERALHTVPKPPEICQWANFLRNHDELSLDKLSDDERREVFAAFGAEPDMQIYERGIRRRLAPMLGGDQRRIRLALSLLLTQPGTPVLWYGDEIGMGDDLALPERNSVRTPMQWTARANGGFSSAPPDRLIRPATQSGPYGYERVNVADQQRDPESLLSWVESAIRVRRLCPEFGWGEWRLLDLGDPCVFAFCCSWRGGTSIAIHNLADTPTEVELDLSSYEADHLFDLLGNREYPIEEGRRRRVELDGYGYRWFRIGSQPQVPSIHSV